MLKVPSHRLLDSFLWEKSSLPPLSPRPSVAFSSLILPVGGTPTSTARPVANHRRLRFLCLTPPLPSSFPLPPSPHLLQLPDGPSGLDPDLHCMSDGEVPPVEDGSIRVEVTAAIGIQDFGDYCYFR